MATSVEAPLMAHSEADGPDRDNESRQYDAEGEGEADSLTGSSRIHDDRPGLFVWLLTLAAGISGLLFGYDTGVISATLVSIDTSLSNRPLTSLDKSLITSSTALFALLISPFSSVLADTLGRKRVILVADILFVAGAVVQAISPTVPCMIAGRAIVGAAVGAASFVVPLYIAEVAPAAFRGRLVTMNVLCVTLGQVVAYVIGWVFAEYGAHDSGWRWMVGLGAVPAAVQSVMLLGMPETPRWLVMMGRVAAAKAVVLRVAGGGRGGKDAPDELVSMAAALVREIEVEVREEERAKRRRDRLSGGGEDGASSRWGTGWRELLAEGKNRRALAIACLLQGLQQLCGFNSLMYFSATIFTLVGFSIPTLTSLTVAVTNFLFTVVALFLIDRIGRRRILLYSLPFMVIGLLLSAYGFSFIDLHPKTSVASMPTSVSSSHDVSPASAPGSIAVAILTGRDAAVPEKGAAILILASIMLYVAAYALGLGNVPWMQSELFPLSVRALGSGVATATNWGANFIVGLTFLPFMEALSPSWTFVLYAGICALGCSLVWRIYPETAGLSLEETTALLESDWGVRR